MNEQNLNPINSKNMAREYQKRSVEARRRNTEERKSLKAAFDALLEKDYTDSKGNTLSGAQLSALNVFKKAMKGDLRAFELMRDTAGQKPVDKVMMAEVEQSVIDEVEKMVLGE